MATEVCLTELDQSPSVTSIFGHNRALGVVKPLPASINFKLFYFDHICF